MRPLGSFFNRTAQSLPRLAGVLVLEQVAPVISAVTKQRWLLVAIMPNRLIGMEVWPSPQDNNVRALSSEWFQAQGYSSFVIHSPSLSLQKISSCTFPTVGPWKRSHQLIMTSEYLAPA